MKQAIGAYRSITATPEFRELERLRSKARHDEAQALHHAAKVAVAENDEKWQGVVGGKIADVATRYQYDSRESFSKAFTRFHGMPPSKIRRGTAKFFHPLTINISIHGVLARFKEQNAKLRSRLKELESSGVVNEAVFKALDRFDAELSGVTADERLSETVSRVFADFSVMRERDVRKIIAGNQTGAFGTDNQDFTGYVNRLKDCDAQVQWTLFMPDMVKHQQDGFQVDSFEYITMPAMRLVGKEVELDTEKDSWEISGDEVLTIYRKFDERCFSTATAIRAPRVCSA
ncbi:MAG: hypothetical protein LBC65_02145 [Oscillospiraceae bacterium]|jgi:AraC-like DNA-binding protein|nr:hypothetical protein [Oscillospiraceae bacterium]